MANLTYAQINQAVNKALTDWTAINPKTTKEDWNKLPKDERECLVAKARNELFSEEVETEIKEVNQKNDKQKEKKKQKSSYMK